MLKTMAALWVGILVHLVPILCNSNNTLIEQQLETEFDLREPRSFGPPKEYLVVRPGGFNTMSHFTADGTYINTQPVTSWERFALNYWFETRTPYSSCDMVPAGISTLFDWSMQIPCTFGNPLKAPKTIFVHNYMLPHFIESTLHFMDPTYRFVLVSGGTDMTIPRGAGDSRYHLLRGFSQNTDGGAYFQMLLNDPRLIHWFCENHDLKHPKLSTMPTGLVNEIHDEAVRDMPHTITPFADRPLKILVSDRVRTGSGQWATRARVIEMCDALPEFCMRPPSAPDMSNGVSHSDFVKLVASVPFIACAHGGGMDPSPKAWEAIMFGTIPIIQRSTLDDAYAHLPVAFVDSWEELLQPANSSALEARLKKWLVQLQPYYQDGSALRKKTLDKLKTSYWMEQVHRKVAEYYKPEEDRNGRNKTITTDEAADAAAAADNSTSSRSDPANAAETRTLLRKNPNQALNNQPHASHKSPKSTDGSGREVEVLRGAEEEQEQDERRRTVRALRAAAFRQVKAQGQEAELALPLAEGRKGSSSQSGRGQQLRRGTVVGQ